LLIDGCEPTGINPYWECVGHPHDQTCKLQIQKWHVPLSSMSSDLIIRVVSCLNPFPSISFLAVLPSHDKLNSAFKAEATGSFLVATRAIVDLGYHKGREGHSNPQEITDCRGLRSILSWCRWVIDSVQTLHE